MFLFKKNKELYRDCAKILSEEGYSDNYISSVKSIMESAKKASEISEGKSYLASAYLFRGEINESVKLFSECDTEKLPEIIRQSHSANYHLALFLLNRINETEEIYQKLNKFILSDSSILMRRSMGIHQFAKENYDAAVTVFLKAYKDAAGFSKQSPSMLDLCLTKALMKLEMYKTAAGYTKDFADYDSLGKIGILARDMKKKIFDELSPEGKVKMIKNKKHKK